MIQRITPFVIGITLLISGCASQQDKQDTTDFNTGSTLLKVAHLASPTADGSSLFITVDGKDAGFLPVGQAVLLHVPEGQHQVGGYARSLIGHVTIPGITVTTAADSPRFVAYKVTQYDPLFTQRGIDPLPDSAPLPKKQVAKSEPLPVPKITELSMPESAPVPDASSALSSATSEATTPVAQGNASQPASVTPALPAVVTDSTPDTSATSQAAASSPATSEQSGAAVPADTSATAQQSVSTP